MLSSVTIAWVYFPVDENINNKEMVVQKKVAFIGLGTMGYPMAAHLQKAGYQVTVYNRTHEKAINWVKEYGGESALTPAIAAKEAEIIFTCVGK